MGWPILTALLAFGFGCFGTFVAVRKRRNALEGLIIGTLLGPVGVLVVTLLPRGMQEASDTTPAGAVRSRRYSIDEHGLVTETATRFRTTLEESDPNWQSIEYHRKRKIVGAIDKQILQITSLYRRRRSR